MDGDADAVFLEVVVVPFADVGDAGEGEGEAEAEEVFEEALLAAADAQAAIFSDGELEVDGEVLVSAQIIDDAAALLAVDHVGVEAAAGAGEIEGADPGDGLAAQGIEVGVVFDDEAGCPGRIRGT